MQRNSSFLSCGIKLSNWYIYIYIYIYRMDVQKVLSFTFKEEPQLYFFVVKAHYYFFFFYKTRKKSELVFLFS